MFLYTDVKTWHHLSSFFKKIKRISKFLHHFANYRMHQLFRIFHKIWSHVLRAPPSPRSRKTSPNLHPAKTPPHTAFAITRIRDFQAIHFANGMRNEASLYRHPFTTIASSQDQHEYTRRRARPHLPAPVPAKTGKTGRQYRGLFRTERRRYTQPKP